MNNLYFLRGYASEMNCKTKFSLNDDQTDMLSKMGVKKCAMLPFFLMALYHLSSDPFSSRECESIESAFPSGQKPIHFAMRVSARYKKETREKCAAALSSHFVGIFTQERTGEDFELWALVHISEIQMIVHRQNEFVLLETPETKIVLSGQSTTKFAQLLYRNYCLSYSMNDPEDVVEVRCDNMDLFPDIRLMVSPSQRFQFAYFAMCSLNNVKFNQDVVRYIHSLLLSGNSIVDVSLLPVNLFGSSDSFVPIFESLKLLRYITGICLTDVERPDVLLEFVPVLSYCENMRIVHFENCGATEGLAELAHAVRKSENFGVSYWNLSKNKFTDFSSFPFIIDHSVEQLLYINLNDCGISAQDGAEIFRALREHEMIDSLRHLHYAGNEMDDKELLTEFAGFLKVARLQTIDLHGYSRGAEGIMKCLNKYETCLETLIVSDSEYSHEAISQLLIFLKETTTLRRLDISGMNLPPESVAGIIHTIVRNRELRDFSLIMDNLDLHGDNLLPIFRAFLDEERLSKWKELSFNNNGLDYQDLKNLVPLLKRMRKLESISLNGNFNSDMYGIGVLLKELLNIQSIKKIAVAGGNHQHLGDELQPFFRALAKHRDLVYLDISKNMMGPQISPYLVQILHGCNKLETLFIDGNNFDATDKMEQLIDAVSDSQNLICFGFPVKDAMTMVAEIEDEDVKNSMIGRLAELQISAAKAINEHRLAKGLPGELPFDAKPEIIDLIKSISKLTRKRMAHNREQMKTHSCVCEVFGLPLPFQKVGEVVTDGGQVEDVDIGKMAVYETESMARIVKETNPAYPDFYNTTTIGPNIRTLLTGQLSVPSKSRKRKKSYSSEDSQEAERRVRKRKLRDLHAVRSDSNFDIRQHKKDRQINSDYDSSPPKSRKSRYHKTYSDEDRLHHYSQIRVQKRSVRGYESDSDSYNDSRSRQWRKHRQDYREKRFVDKGTAKSKSKKDRPRITFEFDREEYGAHRNEKPSQREPKILETRGAIGGDSIDHLMQTGYRTLTQKDHLREQQLNRQSAVPALKRSRHKKWAASRNKYDAEFSSESEYEDSSPPSTQVRKVPAPKLHLSRINFDSSSDEEVFHKGVSLHTSSSGHVSLSSDGLAPQPQPNSEERSTSSDFHSEDTKVLLHPSIDDMVGPPPQHQYIQDSDLEPPQPMHDGGLNWSGTDDVPEPPLRQNASNEHLSGILDSSGDEHTPPPSDLHAESDNADMHGDIGSKPTSDNQIELSWSGDDANPPPPAPQGSDGDDNGEVRDSRRGGDVEQDGVILANAKRIAWPPPPESDAETHQIVAISSNDEEFRPFAQDIPIVDASIMSLFSSSSPAEQDPPPPIDNDSEAEQPAPKIPPMQPRPKPPLRNNTPPMRPDLDSEPELDTPPRPANHFNVDKYALSSLARSPHLATKQSVIDYAHSMLLAEGMEDIGRYKLRDTRR